MNKPNVYVTRSIPEPGLKLISESANMVLHEGDLPPSRAELLSNTKDVDGILCMLTDKIDDELIANAKNLKVISSLSVGYDHIDIAAATKRGIYVSHTPDVLTDSVADLVFGLILSTARRIVESDQLIRNKKWTLPWSPTFMLGSEVYGKTLGILGLGRIGKEVALRASGFKMNLLYYDIVRLPESVEKELSVTYVDVDTLFKESDFLSIHLSLNKNTVNFVDSAKLSMMKKSSILINTSRGPVVNESDMVEALKSKRIRSAGLDVFSTEPLNIDNPLISLSDIVLMPHLSSATLETRSKMSELAANNLLLVLQGKEPITIVNPDVVNSVS